MISVIIPALNESEGLASLYQRLSACAVEWHEDYECILVDDGSTDQTLNQAAKLTLENPHWKVVSLSRNFGHQAAITAGLEHACGDLVAIIDADLQDPPEEIHRFIAKCREGFDIVYAIRTKRKEGWIKRISYKLYYRLLASLASIPVPLDAGDFCVMNRRAVQALLALPERSRFIRGLRSWIGFRQVGLIYEREKRAAGAPKYTFRHLTQLALDGIVNFSSMPLRMILVAGMALGLISMLATVVAVVQYAFDLTIGIYNPRDHTGWTLIMLVVLFFFSAQIFCLGIIGEYVGRLFDEAKKRPVYLVARTVNVGKGDTSDFPPMDGIATYM